MYYREKYWERAGQSYTKIQNVIEIGKMREKKRERDFRMRERK